MNFKAGRRRNAGFRKGFRDDERTRELCGTWAGFKARARVIERRKRTSIFGTRPSPWATVAVCGSPWVSLSQF
jgi:hypothetical protein